MDIPLVIDLIRDLTYPLNYCCLDRVSESKRQEMLVALETLLEDFDYSARSHKLNFKKFGISNPAQQEQLRAGLATLCEQVREKFYEDKYVWRNPSISRELRATVLNQVVRPLFRERYRIDIPRRLSEHGIARTRNLVTYDSHTHDRERNIIEFPMALMGIPMRDYSQHAVREGDLHIFEGHSEVHTCLHHNHTINVRPEGGDILTTSCYQAQSSAERLLTHLHHGQPSSTTGVIHLEREEVFVEKVAEDLSGVLFHGAARGAGHSESPNRFMRTSLEETSALPEETRQLHTISHTRVNLQRSPSGARLYLGTEENYFARRADLLNRRMREILQKVQDKDTLSPLNAILYSIPLDFRNIHPEIGEDYIGRLFEGLSTIEGFHSFCRRFVNIDTFQINYEALNAFLLQPDAYEHNRLQGENRVPVAQRDCLWINQQGTPQRRTQRLEGAHKEHLEKRAEKKEKRKQISR